MMIVGVVLHMYNLFSDIQYGVEVPFASDVLRISQLTFVFLPYVYLLHLVYFSKNEDYKGNYTRATYLFLGAAEIY